MPSTAQRNTVMKTSAMRSLVIQHLSECPKTRRLDELAIAVFICTMKITKNKESSDQVQVLLNASPNENILPVWARLILIDTSTRNVAIVDQCHLKSDDKCTSCISSV